MTYSMKPLACDPARIKGMSERLIVSHYENNYGGAVKRLNAITDQLASLDFDTTPNFVVNGLKREQLIATNSMILHEVFFDARLLLTATDTTFSSPGKVALWTKADSVTHFDRLEIKPLHTSGR